MDNNAEGPIGVIWDLTQAFYIHQTTASGGVASYTPDASLEAAFYAVMDASRFSTLYSGTTLQPKALSALPCIRY